MLAELHGLYRGASNLDVGNVGGLEALSTKAQNRIDRAVDAPTTGVGFDPSPGHSKVVANDVLYLKTSNVGVQQLHKQKSSSYGTVHLGEYCKTVKTDQGKMSL